MIPLNIYLQDASAEQIASAVVEYGNAIKDLVRANIFPGDMLWKNFGVTRHGRVVFYDYDEIEYLTDCNFRKVPEARNEEDEMSGEVWYRVGPKDVFPETFAPFLLGNPAVREVFMAAPRRPARRRPSGKATSRKSWPATCMMSSHTRRRSASRSSAPAGPHRLHQLDSPKGATMADSIVIVSAARTPIGGLLGDFSALAAHQLGSVAIKAAVERAGITGDAVNEVLMGNCLMAGQGQAPARQAALGAGLPQSAGAVTLSKMCGSGMRAMMFAHDMLKAESAEIVVAGGMESMTNAPHLTFARKGVRYGAAQLYDHMAIDGLEDAYERGKAMGVFAEQCVDKYKFSREAMDQFAIDSTKRSKQANEDGSFAWEIAPVTRAGQGRRDRDQATTSSRSRPSSTRSRA